MSKTISVILATALVGAACGEAETTANGTEDLAQQGGNAPAQSAPAANEAMMPGAMPPATPVDPPATPVDPPATPVDPPATPVDPPAAPGEPGATPVGLPPEPVNPTPNPEPQAPGPVSPQPAPENMLPPMGGAPAEQPEPAAAGAPPEPDAPAPVPAPAPAPGNCPASELIGWASEAGGTKGGEGGETVTVSDGGAMKSALSGDTPTIIEFSGTVSGSFEIGSNKTLRGTTKDATIKGNINIGGGDNIIMQNFHLDAGGKNDGIQITGAGEHIWADHLAISDASDGNFDIKRLSNYITISWTKFFYTRGGGHRFSNLIGHSDGHDDTGKLKVTIHHSWWAEGVQERMPRVRYGQVHVFNNYYSSDAQSYGVRAAHASDVLIENNFFDGVKDSHKIDLENGAPAKVTATGNVYEGTSGRKDTKGMSFTPPYQYELHEGEAVKALVMECAGPR